MIRLIPKIPIRNNRGTVAADREDERGKEGTGFVDRQAGAGGQTTAASREKRQARAEYNTSDGSTARQEKKLEKRQEQHRRKERKAIRVQEKKQEKKKLRFMKSFQSAVAFDDAEGVSVSEWFLSICWIKIPVIGFVYVLILALSKKIHPAKKNFARGYLVYRCLVLILSLTIMYVLYQVGLSFIDDMLAFVK